MKESALLPFKLRGTETELFAIDSKEMQIPKCAIQFTRWHGQTLKETFGNKPLIDIDGMPMFAELAIMKEFEKAGWEARWVETYGTKEPKCLTEWKDLPYKQQQHCPFKDESINDLLKAIAKQNNNSYSGCWDVVAKKGDQIIFAESKRLKKDSIRGTQINWLAAALKCGLRPENFLVVGWELH